MIGSPRRAVSSRVAQRRRRIGALSAAVAVVLFASGCESEVGLGGTISEVVDISDTELTVGTSNVPGDETAHAFVIDTGAGTIRSLGTAGGTESAAVAVTNDKLVVGRSVLPDGREVGVVWDLASGAERVLPRGLYEKALPLAVNNARKIVGTGVRQLAGRTVTEAVTWDGNGNGDPRPVVTGSGVLPDSSATDVNDRGDVVGNLAPTVSAGATGFVWRESNPGAQRLPSPYPSELPTPGPVPVQTGVTGLNANGDIVGWATDARTGQRKGVVWDAESLRVTRVLELAAPTVLVDVNDAGIALGHSLDANGAPARPFCLNLATGKVADIATSGVARALNEIGQAVGSAENQAATWDVRACQQ